MVRVRISLAITLLVAAGMGTSLQAGVTKEQIARYRELRREFFLAIALAPSTSGKPRKEHRKYLKEVTRFGKELAETSPAYAAAAGYLRARMLLKVGDIKGARSAFDQSLESLARAKKSEEPVPAGMPSECAVRVFRALSFFGDGNAKVIEQMEAIPQDIAKPRYHEVGATVNDWAETLETRGEDALALRVYLLIKRWELWQDEAENPERRIRMLRLRTGEEQGAPAKPGDN